MRSLGMQPRSADFEGSRGDLSGLAKPGRDDVRSGAGVAGAADAARLSDRTWLAPPGESSPGWRPRPRAGLRAAGVSAGDRVLIVLGEPPGIPDRRDRADGHCAVPVPAYTADTVTDHAHIMRDCGARVAIVSSPGTGPASVRAARPELTGGLDLLVLTDGDRCRDPSPPDSWEEPVARRPAPDDIAAEAAAIPPRAGLPDLHLRHRRRAQGGDAPAPLHPVELPRRVQLMRPLQLHTRSTCPFCRCRTPSSIRPASSSC